ncbi:tripartite tricarboxylate transporter substrate binding protein BugD [Neoroseomonas oryzicola]|uniref:Tripartite tricarboxylate transporter substrate binding protein BugD n=1 Tax=Neoroseomonas oryzicola TaxID=535904 RepID=A0A9X9WIR3_9PROT|nr:tripartite tricarboxylate transporter substrate binding protein BugD [Neoroseomonas oryzicola]MBR0660223.1 tripartite tricarboxylate transporter substrate binding protein BugD [Neoroseomonas oryzicola]NKE16702.1 tripartite tricarboxylate transporter substrate binding protein BugD [Neoroseomonas oryzicola]
MTQFTRRDVVAGLSAIATSGLAAPALAQAAYPSRPITMVIPFAAGGPTDTVGRLIAQAMSADLGQPVVVENVGGAGGTLGAQRVAGARPDGYSILLHHIGMATIPTLYRRLAYDPVNGFETLGLVTEVPMTLIARRNIEANSLAELVALIRQRGENLNYANAGIGAASHLCGLLLMKAVDTRMTTVPYRGTGPAMNDLVAGTVDIMCDQTTNTTEQIRAGTVRAFAVTTEQRVAALPDLPTSAQGGLPGFEVSVWHGLYAPKGTPAPIVARLNQALVKALQDEGIARRFADLGTAPVAAARATPEIHRQFWQADIAKWRPLIQAAGQFAD